MRLDELIPLIRKNVSNVQRNGVPNGLICLKGGELADEIRKSPGTPLVDNLADYFAEPFFETKKLVFVAM